jgi:acetylornithine deacetylase/succinyl-diaminopimelate desuccinylase-like protein
MFMMDDIANHLEAQHAPLKTALIELVRLPSVCDEGAGGYPFGAAIDQALRQALRIAGDLGFKTHYGDGGYYGYAEIGAGAEMLGILGHLDVVPPGKLEDWANDPFDPVEKDGMLYGRGTQDDKGPMMAALYAVKALMQAGVKFNKRVRFIFEMVILILSITLGVLLGTLVISPHKFVSITAESGQLYKRQEA